MPLIKIRTPEQRFYIACAALRCFAEPSRFVCLTDGRACASAVQLGQPSQTPRYFAGWSAGLWQGHQPCGTTHKPPCVPHQTCCVSREHGTGEAVLKAGLVAILADWSTDVEQEAGHDTCCQVRLQHDEVQLCAYMHAVQLSLLSHCLLVVMCSLALSCCGGT